MHDFAGRRARVLRELGDGVMLLPAAPQLHSSRDTEFPYRPDSELHYLTGCTEPGAVAVLGAEVEGGPFVLFVRPRDPEAERWTGPRPSLEEARELWGADTVHPLTEVSERLPELLRSTRTLHYRGESSGAVDGIVRQVQAFARGRGARTGTGPRTLVDPGEILDEMRLIKEPSEIACIRDAVAISVDAFRCAIGRVGPGVGEWEIEASLDGAFRWGGADRSAFETIVGSGANACVLHYVANASTIGEDDLVLIDAGAIRDMYGADITRTVPASGAFTPRQRELYELVDRARRAAIAACLPGEPVGGMHRAAVRVLTEGLIEMGVMKGPLDEALEEERYKLLFPHQTSHWLGLDVHDVGDYARDGDERKLEPGMVLTVEPGLYFPPAGAEALPEGLVGIGIRLEDDVLVTHGEPEVLTAELPVEAEAVLALMS